MLLPDNIIKRMRAQAFGKRRIGLAGKKVGHGGFRERGFQTTWIIAGRLKRGLTLFGHNVNIVFIQNLQDFPTDNDTFCC